jgi:hypothetical protein
VEFGQVTTAKLDERGWPQMSRSAIPSSVRSLPFDQVANALTETRVNVSAAARSLGVPPGDLRRALAIVRPLLDLVVEIEEQRIDKAVSNLDAMLDSANDGLRKEGSLFVLRQHKRAVDRGWRQPDAEVNVNANVRMETVRIVWRDGTHVADIECPVSELPRTIEHDPDERARIDAERAAARTDADEERRRQGDHDSH